MELLKVMVLTTDKRKASVYMDEQLKADLEKLAKAESRSVSNLLELLAKEAVAKAKREGRI